MQGKPEKKGLEDFQFAGGAEMEDFVEGYNEACDDWEKYHEWLLKNNSWYECFETTLPGEEEIEKIIENEMDVARKMDGYADAHNLAKAIHKRIKGE